MAKTKKVPPQPTKGVRKEVRKDSNIHVRVTEAQKAKLSEAAAKAGLGVSSWLLMLGLREADKGDK